MRKVKFNRSIGSTGCESGYLNKGMFLGWGTACQTYNAELKAVLTVAMIELPDGTVEEVLPERIKFVNPSFIETNKPAVKFELEIIDKAEELIERLGMDNALNACSEEMKRTSGNLDYKIEFETASKVEACIADLRIIRRED